MSWVLAAIFYVGFGVATDAHHALAWIGMAAACVWFGYSARNWGHDERVPGDDRG